MVETVRPLVGEFDPRVCSRCKHNRKTCNCHYPYPTKQPLYSRAQYEADMQAVEFLDQLASKAVADGNMTGIESLRVSAECKWMRRLCKAALFRTRMMLASRRQESAEVERTHRNTLVGMVDGNNILLPTALAESIRAERSKDGQGKQDK